MTETTLQTAAALGWNLVDIPDEKVPLAPEPLARKVREMADARLTEG